MTEIQHFTNSEFDLEIEPRGDSFVVRASGLARALGFAEARDLVRSIPDNEKGSELAPTLGGDQRVWFVTEAGFYRALGQRQLGRIKNSEMRDLVTRFQNWVYQEVLPAIRKTGRYEVAAAKSSEIQIDTNNLDDIELLNRALTSAIQIAKDERAGRIAAEGKVVELEPKAVRWDISRGGDGLTITEFNRKYFPDVKQTAFFDHLYSQGLLLDQRGKGSLNKKTGKHRDGHEHRHPSYLGRAYFYLHTEIDAQGISRNYAKVRPGERELALRELLIKAGLRPALDTLLDLDTNTRASNELEAGS